MTFTFNDAIPASGNNPSVDQPKMLVNNISTAGIINVDHYGFNQANGGRHKQAQLVSLASVPGSLINGEGTLYVKQAEGALGVNESQLFYTPDAPGVPKEYQMTRVINASAGTFGTDTAYASPPEPVTTEGGWTFLPGGLLLQYGSIAPVLTPGNTAVVYPVQFSTGPAFNIQVTAVGTSGLGDVSAGIRVGSSGATGFTATTQSNGNVVLYYWIAIGK